MSAAKLKLPAFVPPPLAVVRERRRQIALQTAQLRAAANAARRAAGDIEVSLADRWYIIGDTGSGKTTFARELTRRLHGLYPGAAVYVLDSKGAGDFAGWPGLVQQQDAPRPVPPGHIQVWQPDDDDATQYQAWLQAILKARRPAIVFVDELSSLGRAQSGTSYPIALTRLQKQGRGLGICSIVLSQEAAFIPRQVPALATHVAAFRLGDDRHAKENVARLLGHELYNEPTGDYGFWYRRLQPRRVPAVEYESHADFF